MIQFKITLMNIYYRYTSVSYYTATITIQKKSFFMIPYLDK
nr:hypothetical protein CJLB15_00106 [Campylobacter phage CJLB-15]